MDNDNRIIGSGNGGFQTYRRSTQPTPACFLSPATETKRELPASLNQAAANGQNSECTIREQDRFVPIKNVIRIMCKILPPHAKIVDDSKMTIQEYVSEFISFIISEANNYCHRDQRKTITAEDVIWAMRTVGFDDYIKPLSLYLHHYRAYDGGKCESLRRKPLLLKHPIVHLPPNFQMAHHQYGYFVFPQVMCHGCMQGDELNVRTSQYAVVDVDSEGESLAKESKE